MTGGYVGEENSKSMYDELAGRLQKIEGQASFEAKLQEKCEVLEGRIVLLERFMVFFDCAKLDHLMGLVGTVDMLQVTVNNLLKAAVDEQKPVDVPATDRRPPDEHSSLLPPESNFDSLQIEVEAYENNEWAEIRIPHSTDVRTPPANAFTTEVKVPVVKKAAPVDSVRLDATAASTAAVNFTDVNLVSDSRRSSKASRVPSKRAGSAPEGLIDRQEFGQVLRKLKGCWTEKQIDQMFFTAAPDKSGRINLEEFLNWVFPEGTCHNNVLFAVPDLASIRTQECRTDSVLEQASETAAASAFT